MAVKKFLKEMRGKDSRELKLDRQSLSKELFELRFRAATDEIAQTSRFSELKRSIARINTILREREIAEADENRGETSAV